MREKRAVRKDGILSKRRTIRFDSRKEDFGREDGIDRRVHPELSDSFSVLHAKESQPILLSVDQASPVFKEVDEYIIKVLGSTGVIGIIDRSEHPELDGMNLEEIKESGENFIIYSSFNPEEFHGMSVRKNGEEAMTAAAQTFSVMFPEFFGNRPKNTPRNLKELCRALGLNPKRDRDKVRADIRLVFDLCFEEIELS